MNSKTSFFKALKKYQNICDARIVEIKQVGEILTVTNVMQSYTKKTVKVRLLTANVMMSMNRHGFSNPNQIKIKYNQKIL
ncbi:hypothetical protein [Nitrosopumilus maritimus]|uniref:hypothetical protein n=1 Tax=Nitrosopumilus maritimus TaxID=338192 RepID=UPI0011E58659|nr:hypothetical protein [Nitrosopumilus maritimus]